MPVASVAMDGDCRPAGFLFELACRSADNNQRLNTEGRDCH